MKVRYFSLVFSVLFIKFIVVISQNNKEKPRKNVCSTYEDYLRIETSENCWYNPDVESSLEEIILSKGYPLEKYSVTTDDGYILQIFRIPRKLNNKGIAFLEHPATTTAICWVGFGKNSSLAFFLYDKGYDVWLGNARGTNYGRKHVKLNPADMKFWDFSYHEIAIYDLPAIFKYIRFKTNNKQKISAIGHSMGGTALLIYASLLPEHAKKHLNVMIPLSPGTRYRYIRSTIVKFTARIMTNNVMDFLNNLGLWEPMPKNGLIQTVRKIACNIGGISHYLCTLMDAFSSGASFDNAPEFQPLAHANSPYGVSLKTIIHYCQSIRTGNFSYFDYGKTKNLQLYKQEQPSEYPVSNIALPTFIIFGKEDLIDSSRDLIDVFNLMQDSAKVFGYREITGFNHYDTLYSKKVREKVHYPILEVIEKVT